MMESSTATSTTSMNERVSRAFDLANKAASFEHHLDSQTSSAKINQDISNEQLNQLVTFARQAVDNYMAACSEFMSLLPEFANRGKAKAQAVICENVSYLMNRVAKLNNLIQELVIFDESDSDSEDEDQKAQSPKGATRMKAVVDKLEKKRTNIVREIQDSERQYLTNLRTLKNVYITRLVSENEDSFILSIEDSKIIFGNLDEIIGLSETFLAALGNRLAHWSSEETIGDVFNEHAMFFKIYVMYTNNYEYGVNKLLNLFETNKEAKAVADAASKSGVKDIASLMINPIQRLPRYVLFLKELAKCTPESHLDAPNIKLAVKQFEEVAAHVNERLRKHENNSKVLEIQSKLWKVRGSPCLLSPGRRYIMEGKMYKIRSSGVLAEVHVFLFSDILVYATQTVLLPGRYHYRNQFEFYGAKVSDIEARQQTAFIHGSQSAFTISSPNGVRTFVCDSQNQRDVWVNTINELITEKRDKIRSMEIHRKSNSHKSVTIEGSPIMAEAERRIKSLSLRRRSNEENLAGDRAAAV